MKEDNLKSLCTSWFQTLWHSGKNKTMKTLKRSVVASGDDWMRHRGFGRQRNYSRQYCNCGYLSHICQNSQKVQHKEWTLMETRPLGDNNVSGGSLMITNAPLRCGRLGGQQCRRLCTSRARRRLGTLSSFCSVFLWTSNCSKILSQFSAEWIARPSLMTDASEVLIPLIELWPTEAAKGHSTS